MRPDQRPGREKREGGQIPAGNHRSRAGQSPDIIEKDLEAQGEPGLKGDTPMRSGEMIDDEPHSAHDEFHDSEQPPPPQERRTRTSANPNMRVKDKNTGIKNRDASGKKQSSRPRTNKGRNSADAGESRPKVQTRTENPSM